MSHGDEDKNSWQENRRKKIGIHRTEKEVEEISDGEDKMQQEYEGGDKKVNNSRVSDGTLGQAAISTTSFFHIFPITMEVRGGYSMLTVEGVQKYVFVRHFQCREG